MKKHGHAAFTRKDVEDARRGRPAGDLDDYAAARGLTVRGQALLARFSVAQPRWPDYTFNVLTGELAPGVLGVVEHELEEIEVNDNGRLSMTGGFHDVRHAARRFDTWSLLPGIVDEVLELVANRRQAPDKPFAAPAVWVPATRVIVRAPETALLPKITARTAERFPVLGNPKLEDEGLPGMRLAGGDDIDPQLRWELFAGASATVLDGLNAPYLQVRIAEGLVSIQRNGFVSDLAALDALVEAAVFVAAAACAAGRARCAPQRFDVPLPPPPDLDLRGILDDPHRRPMPEQADAFRRAASELGLTNEDPVALHRTIPGLAVPGIAVGCLYGRAGGWSSVGRLAWFTERRFAAGALRAAAIFPARPGAQTPLGGVQVEGTDLIAEVRDGVAFCWRLKPAIAHLESRPLLAMAAEAMRSLELADV